MPVEVKTRLTVADIDRMLREGEIDPDAQFELVDGEILWLSPTHHRHGQICGLIIFALFPFARGIGARMLDGQAGFMVGEHYQQLRAPDVALVTKERLHILPDDGFATEAPDLAVEILSADQRTEAYARPKVREYLASGAKLVWLVDPVTRTVRVYRPGSSDIVVHTEDSDIALDAIAPGFSARVSSFFP